MQSSIPLVCWSYEVKETLIGDDKVFQFEADFEDIYLIDDFSVDGKYLRCVQKQFSPTIYNVQHIEGVTLHQLIAKNDLISEQNIITILAQIVEGLHILYKQNILGRCFTIDNIIWDGQQVTLMNFGFYPSVWQEYQNYNHKLDVLLLGKIAVSLIFQIEDDDKVDIEQCILNAPVDFRLKQLVFKMLREAQKRIEMNEVAEFFKDKLSPECLTYYRESYEINCKKIDDSISMREQQTEHIIQFKQDYKFQVKQIIQIPYLLFCNKSDEEDLEIWDQLHDQLYKFYLLTQVESIANDIEIDDEEFKLQLLFIVDKTILILKQNFLNDINTQLKQEHPYFYNTSKSLKTLQKVLKDSIMIEKQFLLTKDVDEFSEAINPKFERNFSKDIWEKNFEDIKIPFRWYVSKCYKILEKRIDESEGNDEKLLLKKQLKLLLALIVNRVMENKDTHFKTLKQIVKCKTVFPNDIELRFFVEANAGQLREQIKEIYDMYFSKK